MYLLNTVISKEIIQNVKTAKPFQTQGKVNGFFVVVCSNSFFLCWKPFCTKQACSARLRSLGYKKGWQRFICPQLFLYYPCFINRLNKGSSLFSLWISWEFLDSLEREIYLYFKSGIFLKGLYMFILYKDRGVLGEGTSSPPPYACPLWGGESWGGNF